jgi:hypothetical protein
MSIVALTYAVLCACIAYNTLIMAKQSFNSGQAFAAGVLVLCSMYYFYMAFSLVMVAMTTSIVFMGADILPLIFFTLVAALTSYVASSYKESEGKSAKVYHMFNKAGSKLFATGKIVNHTIKEKIATSRDYVAEKIATNKGPSETVA